MVDEYWCGAKELCWWEYIVVGGRYFNGEGIVVVGRFCCGEKVLLWWEVLLWLTDIVLMGRCSFGCQMFL